MIIEKVKLPSNGLLGYPAEVTVRELKGSELSVIYTSLSDSSVDYVLKQALVDDSKNIDLDMMADQDKLFLLIKLRILTLGPNLIQNVKSPYGTQRIQEVELDLASMEVMYLEQKELDKELEVTDQNGTVYVLKRRVPNRKVIEEIMEAKEKHNISSYDDALLRMVSLLDPKIKAPNGYKARPVHEVVDFLGNLPGRQLKEVYNFVEMPFGINPTFEVECEETRQSFLGVVAFSADLFR